MPTYSAPIRDMRFALDTLVGFDRLTALPGCGEMTADVVEAALGEAGRLCSEVLLPLNASGDLEGCRLEGGEVRSPTGFKPAYDLFRDGGWTALACDPAYGGQGLPRVVDACITEMICAANLSFGITPGLSHGAYFALHAHGDEALKARFLPRLVSGDWAGTMCLTEPQCGTDLGLVRTRAVPQPDGSWRVNGSKMFISSGDHDLTGNILHLVLARAPDAPDGTRGISLFLVPKRLEDGRANGVSCGALEHKMGIRASPTCVLNFDDAQGWLIGTLHGGMRQMFTMMNEERLAVGIQGLGLAEAAYQNAVAYARERLQGRSLKGPLHPDLPADPIIVHPDVRRMLLTMRATIEGMRAMAVWVAWHGDLRDRAPDPVVRQEADELVQLMTPVVKALFTDLGFEAVNLGLQVFGGHGYIRDNGMEQLVRDARIAQIYEGTNGIQALDLVGRKLPAHYGRLLRRFFHPALAVAERADNPALSKALGRLQQATAVLAQRGLGDPEEAAAGATEYLRLFGLTAMAVLWAEMAEAAGSGDDDPFLRAKRDTAQFFFDRILPQTSGLFAAIMAGGRSITRFDEAAF
jgi:butyryl-CoA dehydrogenase